MADPLHASTETPKQAPGGFPPFKTETFPSQIFWLVVCFAFLFVVLWRIAGPGINGVITSRAAPSMPISPQPTGRVAMRNPPSAAYQTALAGARARAQTVAEDNRQKLNAEITKAKADAEADAHRAMTDADARIAGTRVAAQGHVIKAAEEAAIAIVARLTGETVSPADAARAVKGG